MNQYKLLSSNILQKIEDEGNTEIILSHLREANTNPLWLLIKEAVSEIRKSIVDALEHTPDKDLPHLREGMKVVRTIETLPEVLLAEITERTRGIKGGDFGFTNQSIKK